MRESQQKQAKLQQALQEGSQNLQQQKARQEAEADAVRRRAEQAEQEKQRELAALRAKKEAEDRARIQREREEDARLHRELQAEKFHSTSVEEARRKAMQQAGISLASGQFCEICRTDLRNSGEFTRCEGKAYHRACLKCCKCSGPVSVVGPIMIQNGLVTCAVCSGGAGGSGTMRFCGN